MLRYMLENAKLLMCLNETWTCTHKQAYTHTLSLSLTHSLTHSLSHSLTHTHRLEGGGTDVGQGRPSLVAGGEEGEAAWASDLLGELGPVGVHLGGGGPHHAQRVVDVHQGERYVQGGESQRYLI